MLQKSDTQTYQSWDHIVVLELRTHWGANTIFFSIILQGFLGLNNKSFHLLCLWLYEIIYSGCLLKMSQGYWVVYTGIDLHQTYP